MQIDEKNDLSLFIKTFCLRQTFSMFLIFFPPSMISFELGTAPFSMFKINVVIKVISIKKKIKIHKQFMG